MKTVLIPNEAFLSYYNGRNCKNPIESPTSLRPIFKHTTTDFGLF